MQATKAAADASAWARAAPRERQAPRQDPPASSPPEGAQWLPRTAYHIGFAGAGPEAFSMLRATLALALLVCIPTALAAGVHVPIAGLDLGSGPTGDAPQGPTFPARRPAAASGPSAAAVATADLRLEKTDSADPVAVGQQFTYNVTVTNDGPSRANDLVVTDTLPAGVSYVSHSGTCTVSGSTVTCTRNTLNSGATAVFRITVQAQTVGNWTNVASVDAAEDDPDASDNSDSETTTVRAAAPGAPTCTSSEAGVHVDWSSVPQATGYNVYRATGTEGGSYVLLATTTSTEHQDTTAAVGQSYSYRVTSLSATGESAPSEACVVVSVPVFGTPLAFGLALVGGVACFAWLRRRR